MYIEKIEVPAFRALRDVCLEFSGLYDPKIFPLGSENGGGKSTLLQLIFILLHCSGEPKRRQYLANLLASESSPPPDTDGERLLASITLRMGAETHELRFLVLSDKFIERKLEDPPEDGFSVVTKLELFERHIPKLAPDDPDARGEYLGSLSSEISSTVERLIKDADRIKAFLRASDFFRIAFILRKHSERYGALICHIPGKSPDEVEQLLQRVAKQVFLLGPSNQQYLFLSKNARRALLALEPMEPTLDTTGAYFVGGTPEARAKFERQRKIAEAAAKPAPLRPQIEYLTKLDKAEAAMPGFFAYDWLAVRPLVELFKAARDEDFKQAVKTGGSYGDSYPQLMKEVNSLLFQKRVRPREDLSGIEFEIVRDDGTVTQLGPEDLSQGELKRLMIYAWLRAKHAKGALVLIDEIEVSFHPDWQVGIIRDLQAWAPDNQYILATHSYELCQALTPRHVRELRPPLQHRDGDAPPQGSSQSADS